MLKNHGLNSRLPFVLLSSLLFGMTCAQAFTQQSANPSPLFSMSLKELLKVQVVSATKSTQQVADAPSIISVVTASEIRRLGARRLIDVLAIIPGFTPLRQPQSDRVMAVRGLALKDGVLVLIDGIPLNDAFDGSFGFYERRVDDIERVEVIRGPGSALYGGYAVSAVVQIFTKAPTDEKSQYQVALGGGSFGEQNIALTGSKDLSTLVDGLAVAASFSYAKNDGDKLTIVQDSLFRPTQAEFLSPLINPSLTPTSRQESFEKYNGHASIEYGDLTVNFLHSQILSHPLLSHVGVVTEVDQTLTEKTQDALSAKYQWTFSSELGLKSKLYWLTNEAKLFGQSQPPQFHGDEDQDGLNEEFISGIIESFSHKTESIGAELELSSDISAQHHLLFGLVVDNTKLIEAQKIANVSLISRGPSAVFPAQELTVQYIQPGIERNLNAIFLQDTWQMNSETSLTSGMRYGDYDDFGSTLNPRLGLVHKFNQGFYGKLLYGEAFKPPTFVQLFDATPTLAASRQRGNQTLDATEIKSIEALIGFDVSDSLQSSLTLFKNDTTNEIFFNSNPGIELWQNSGQRQSKGAEIEVKGQMLGLDYAFINYSYQKTSGVTQGAGANIHPPHRVNFGGSYHINDQFSAGFSWSYYSSPDREQDDSRSPLDAKSLLNLVFHAQDIFLAGLNFQLTISNLLDEDGRDEIEASVGLIDDIPLQGRNTQIGLSYDF